MPYALPTVFAVLAEPSNLPRVLPRITDVTVSPATPEGIPMQLTFNFGSRLGRRSAPGIFTVEEQQTVAFRCREPMPILARWSLQTINATTHVIALLEFDLKPMLGPLAMMAPQTLIKNSVSNELEQALLRVEELLSATV